MTEQNLSLKEIDLSKTTCLGSDELKIGPVYLCLIDGSLFAGRFTMQWYGLHFANWLNLAGIQYDPPGTNSSSWEHIWLIDGAEEIDKEWVDED